MVDLQAILNANRVALLQCGWYYPNYDWQESATKLKYTRPGTFLIRNSADPRFYFSLSVQRQGHEGPTSIRIRFHQGKFCLDADEAISDYMPEFSSVVELVTFYLKLTYMEEVLSSEKRRMNLGLDGNERHVWVDYVGKVNSPICLKKPLLAGPPSLCHLSRLAVQRSVKQAGSQLKKETYERMGVPGKLVTYLNEYRHTI